MMDDFDELDEEDFEINDEGKLLDNQGEGVSYFLSHSHLEENGLFLASFLNITLE